MVQLENGTLQITDLGFNTVGDLLTALGITIEDASDNQLILVLPMVVSASQSENNNQRILSISFPDGVLRSGLTDEKSVSFLTMKMKARVTFICMRIMTAS